MLLEHVPDERLTRPAGEGDDAAFAELYRRYHGPLSGYAARIAGDRSAGEDIAQTALLNALQALRRGSVPAHVGAWLYRIAQRLALDARGRRWDPVGDLEPFDEAVGDGIETSGRRSELLSAVQRLDPARRSVWVLRELKGLSVEETASVLSLSAAQVEQRLFAARNELAEDLVYDRRLGCDDVRAIGVQTLDGRSRRGLGRHLRVCRQCRRVLNGNFGFVPVVVWLRSWITSLLAGPSGDAIAAKAGTVAVAAALAGTTPLVGTTVYRDVAGGKRAHHHTPALAIHASTQAAPAAAVAERAERAQPLPRSGEADGLPRVAVAVVVGAPARPAKHHASGAAAAQRPSVVTAASASVDPAPAPPVEGAGTPPVAVDPAPPAPSGGGIVVTVSPPPAAPAPPEPAPVITPAPAPAPAPTSGTKSDVTTTPSSLPPAPGPRFGSGSGSSRQRDAATTTTATTPPRPPTPAKPAEAGSGTSKRVTAEAISGSESTTTTTAATTTTTTTATSPPTPPTTTQQTTTPAPSTTTPTTTTSSWGSSSHGRSHGHSGPQDS
jgi:RNA polymerase sigma factor (sigma-70 family)